MFLFYQMYLTTLSVFWNKYVLKILKYFHLWIFFKAILNGGF